MEWLYFGTLAQTERAVEQSTTRLVNSLPAERCFYDVEFPTRRALILFGFHPEAELD